MRLTTFRWSAGLTLAFGAVIALAGCDKKGADAGAGNPTMGIPAQGGPPPRQVAEEFLKSLGEGNAGPNDLTPAFRQDLTRPRADVEAEVRDYLARFRGARFVVLEESKFSDAVVLRGRAESPGRTDSFAVRLVNDGSRYTADWLHRSERMGMNLPPRATEELAAAQDAVRNFLDLLLGGDLRLVHALMTPAWRASVAPPTPADTKDGYDYSPGFLTQTTRAWKGEFLGYTVLPAEVRSAQRSAAFIAQLDTGTTKVPFAIHAIQVAGSRWLIEAFDKQ